MKAQKLLNKIDLLFDKSVDRAYRIGKKNIGEINFDLSAPSYRTQGVYFEMLNQFDSTFIDSLFIEADILDLSEEEFKEYLKTNN